MKRLSLLFSLLFMHAPALASDELPLPPAAPGEVVQLYDALNDEKYAPPAALNDGSILVFPFKGGAPAMLRIFPDEPARSHVFTFKHFRAPYSQNVGYRSYHSGAYSSAVTPKGVWLIGPTVELIRHQEAPLSGRLQWPRHQVRTVALDDGSVMVVGGVSSESRDHSYSLMVERVYLDTQNKIRTEVLPPLPGKLNKVGSGEGFSGFSLLHLGKNRVLLAGGYNRKPALLYEPEKKAWRVLKNMSTERVEPAMALLSGGRVWVSGGKDGSNHNVPYTSEIWSPATQSWSPGPALPVAMSGHQAVLTPDRKFVLLAAGENSTVLAWQPGTPEVFIAAQLSVQRLNAGVLSLPNARLALVGGRHARAYGEGWGRRTPGLTIVPLDLVRSGRRLPIWPEASGGALAVRNGMVIALGGQLHHNHWGSDEEIPARHVERMTLASGDVFTLPSLPLSSKHAEACWVDDTHVLAHVEGVEGGPYHWLGLFDRAIGHWTELPVPLDEDKLFNGLYNKHLRLAGCHGSDGWLINEEGMVSRFDTVKVSVEAAPSLQRKRQDFVSRVLADGSVIVAGGREEKDLVASRIENCANCPERYVGFGQFGPSRHYEWFDPVTSEWKTSATAKGEGTHAAILADGRVALLGLAESRQDRGHDAPLMLEISEKGGKRWRTLPLSAKGLPMMRSEDTENFSFSLGVVTLLSVVNEQPWLERALFLGVGEAKSEWWWLPDVDAPQSGWRRLGMAVAPLRFPGGEVDSGITTPQGKRIYFRGSRDGVVAYAK